MIDALLAWQSPLAVLVGGILIAVLCLIGAVLAGGLLLAAPARASVGAAPADLGAREVEFPSRSGATLRGWFIPGQPGKGAVVLLHGAWSSRLVMVRRARLLRERGCAVLLFDFRAHGESSGRHLTFGMLEARDARAAVDYLRAQVPGERVAAIGVSLGGAAALLGAEPLPVEALVLESVFPDIRNALRNRLRAVLGPFGPPLLPLFEYLLPPILGLRLQDIRPIERIGALTMPILVASGTADNRTPLTEAEALFDAASGPKRFWAVDGAGHVDIEEFCSERYRKIVLPFIVENIQIRVD